MKDSSKNFLFVTTSFFFYIVFVSFFLDGGKQCPLCKESVNYQKIDKNLDPNLKDLFSKEGTLLSIVFQHNQRENLVKYINSIDEKNRKLNSTHEQWKDKLVQMHTEYDKLRQQRRLLQGNAQKVVHRPRAPPPSSDLDSSFERAFTANVSVSSRGQVINFFNDYRFL
jgi:hypothetical protein